ncbi:MAG: precorrin-2 C(20)-methyltransferase [Tissierellia bacterium]|nr:precorrin-2 C(20)-methyltransferase [Tissierellia bacterium]
MRRLIGIGTGPGAPDLLTLRAIMAIEEADYIFAPSNRGKTMALDTVRPYLKDKEVILLDFPMMAVDQAAYDRAMATIEETLKEGQVGVYLNIGDSTIYSSFLNMVAQRDFEDLEIDLVPGIPSFVAAANIIGKNLIRKGESFGVYDEVDEDTHFAQDNLAILKTRSLDKTLDLLEDQGYDYDYLEYASLEKELHLRDREAILERKNYMSLVLARKGENQ